MDEIDYKYFDLGARLRDLLIDSGWQSWLAHGLGVFTDIAALVLVIVIADFLTKKILLSVIEKLVKKTNAKWDDYFFEQKVFKNLAHLVPAIIAKQLIPIIFHDLHVSFLKILLKGIDVYMILLMAIVITKALKAFESYSESDLNKLNNQQMRTLSQVFRILTIFIAIISIFSVLLNLKVGALLGGLAGATAIIILIFQDTINGLLANFQITMYDLVRKGDWVSFPKYDADGDVVSIDLTTVKIQNWDKTISVVPAKAFVFDGFVNWRGMTNANARRIKRNILIDINSIKYADDELMERLSQVTLIKESILQTQSKVKQYNIDHNIDTSILINGRRQTNIGIYRSYILEYLRNNPNIDQSYTVMVRQLQPTSEGIPLEVYCFSADIRWVHYEGIQSDIFDHLYAATSVFDLQLFQSPGGTDIRKISV